MASNPSSEAKSILIRTHDLTTALSNDSVGVAGMLLGKELICREVYSKMLLHSYTPAEKAAILIEAVTNTIETAPVKFSDFLEILSEQVCAKEVVESLQSTYQGQLDQIDVSGSSEPIDIASKVETLEDRFDNLQTRIVNELSAKPDITVQKLLNKLTRLPLSLRKEYEASIEKYFPRMRTETQINKLFTAHLNPLTSFIDYGLIEYFIRTFGTDVLKRDMQLYCSEMVAFMKETTIKQLIDLNYFLGQPEIPPKFALVEAKIGEDAAKCTLEQLNTIRGRYCSEVKLSEIVFHLVAVVESNSFIVNWLVPSSLALNLIKASNQVKETVLFQKFNIPSLRLGTMWLYHHLLTPFGAKLKERYQQTQSSPSPVEWLPSPTKKIFRLAMIQRERVQQGYIEDRFVRMTISGRVDDILHAKSPVELEHIFRNTRHGGEILLIEGAPGSGKSTLTVHICQRWGKGELFQQFTVVILVQLRDPAVQRAQTIADLLPVEDAQEVAAELIATNGRGVLWVLDGWDELPPRLQQNSIFCKLVQRILSECSVIVTSRPVSSGDLHPVVSARIEVLGFSPKEQRQYFTECLKGDTKALEALLEKIQENPVVQSICYLPLNAAFIVHTFKYKGQSLPNTEYEIYLSVILSCIQRHFEREGRGHDLQRELASLGDLSRSEAVRNPFQCLCELAYHGVMENKVTFSSSDLPQGSNTLDLLQAIESFLLSGKSMFYNFLHLSIQEILSAYYIATWLSDSEQVSQFQQLFSQPRFASVFQFYAAITKLKSPGIRQVIDRIVEEKSKPLLVSLLCCLHEAQDPSLCRYVAEQLNPITRIQYVELDLTSNLLSPLDCLSVSFFLSSAGMTIEGDLSRCSIGDLGARCLVRYLDRDVDHVGKANIDLVLWRNDIHEEGASHIAGIISKFINYLDLSDNPVGDTGASLISEAVRETATLKTLMLYCCRMASRGAEDLSRALDQNSSLTKLDIGDNSLGDEGISHVAEALKRNKQLKELWISKCGITDKGAASLASALSVNNSLKMLHMGGPKRALTNDGISTIARSLANNSEFVKLAIPKYFGSIAGRLSQEVNEERKRNRLSTIEIEATGTTSVSGPSYY